MVTAYQDLCLGAPLSDVLLLLPFECVVGDTTQQQRRNWTKEEGTASPEGQVPKCDGSSLSKNLAAIRTIRERLSATCCSSGTHTVNTNNHTGFTIIHDSTDLYEIKVIKNLSQRLDGDSQVRVESDLKSTR